MEAINLIGDPWECQRCRESVYVPPLLCETAQMTCIIVDDDTQGLAQEMAQASREKIPPRQ